MADELIPGMSADMDSIIPSIKYVVLFSFNGIFICVISVIDVIEMISKMMFFLVIFGIFNVPSIKPIKKFIVCFGYVFSMIFSMCANMVIDDNIPSVICNMKINSFLFIFGRCAKRSIIGLYTFSIIAIILPLIPGIIFPIPIRNPFA